MARVSTFLHDDDCIEAELLSGPSSTGLCRIRDEESGSIYVRHRDRLRALDEEAQKILEGER